MSACQIANKIRLPTRIDRDFWRGVESERNDCWHSSESELMAFLRSLLHLLIALAVLAQPALAERVGCCCATNRKSEPSQRVATSAPQDARVAGGCPRCRAKGDQRAEQRNPSQGRLQKNCRCVSVATPALMPDRQSTAFEMPAKARTESDSLRLLSDSQPEVVLSESPGVKRTGRELRVWHCSWLA